MDTVSNLPFTAVIEKFPSESYKTTVSLGPWTLEPDEKLQLENTYAAIQENDPIDLYFKSDDPEAKFYFDALDCCPRSPRIDVSDNGEIYCKPSDSPLILYRSNDSYDALRVDMLEIIVIHEGTRYFTFLRIAPKQLKQSEWEIMRDDLENEIRGLSQDIVRRHIGYGTQALGVLPPEDVLSFLILHKFSNELKSALIDIQHRPRYKIVKQYTLENESKAKELDTITIKKYLRQRDRDRMLVVPQRRISYDIQENRWLKKMLRVCELKLDSFILKVEYAIQYHKQLLEDNSTSNTYEIQALAGLSDYMSSATKLKRATNILKSQTWFKDVGAVTSPTIPHALATDSRYGVLYRIYNKLRKSDFDISFDSRYSYAWKKSSVLYEMWCYLKIYRSLLNHYSSTAMANSDIFLSNQVFPFVESGTKLRIESTTLIMDVIYDSVLPRSSKATKKYENPFFIAKSYGGHNRPDITINLYTKNNGWYIGSIILEVKYRKLSSFWNNNGWSSKEQIMSYHRDSKSVLLFEENGFHDIRPVQCVYALTPDIFQQKTESDFDIVLSTFRPSEDNKYTDYVMRQVFSLIDAMEEKSTERYTYLNSSNQNS